MRSILIKYFETTNKYFEVIIAMICIVVAMYFGIITLIYIGECAWNVLH